MKNLTLWQIELFPWYAFLMVWAIGALSVKQAKMTEPLAARLFNGVLVGSGFALLFSESPPLGWLRQHFLVHSPWLDAAGVTFTCAGAAVAIWARVILGSNWSSRVSLKVGHELIRSGPYAYVRHPIYSGLLLSVIGTAMVIGEWRGLLAIALVALAHSLKARREEQVMLSEFGERYRQYRQETGFLIPR